MKMTLNLPNNNNFGAEAKNNFPEISLEGIGDILTHVDNPISQQEDTKTQEDEEPVITEIPDVVEDPIEIKPISLETPTQSKEDLLNLAKKHLGASYENIQINEGEDVISAEDYIQDIDTLLELIEVKHKDEIDALKSTSVSTANLNGLQKDIVDIIAKGGNPTELIKVQSDYMQPLSEIDLDTEEGQIEMVRTALNDGKRPEEEIDMLIEMYTIKGTLEDKALESKAILEKFYQDHLEKVKQFELDKIEEIKTAHKKFSTDVKKEFEGLGYNEATIKKLRSFVSEIQKDENNVGANMTEMDLEYFKLRNDPKEAALLGLFFYDREKYNETVTKKAVTNEQVKTARTIIINKQKTNTSDKSVLQTKLDNKVAPFPEIKLI